LDIGIPLRSVSKVWNSKASSNLQNCWEKISKEAIIHSWERIFRNAKKYLENSELINGFDQQIEVEELSDFDE
jgi:hypothetical protein